MLWCVRHGGINEFLDRSNMLFMELPPEIFLHGKKWDQKSDIWGLGAAILEILFEQKLWNLAEIREQQQVDNQENLEQVSSQRVCSLLLGSTLTFSESLAIDWFRAWGLGFRIWDLGSA